MSLNIISILSSVTSHMKRLGVFDSVNKHEAKSAPSKGTHGAAWIEEIVPLPARSGLNSTTVRITFTIRIYGQMIQEPADAIDTNLMYAVDKLMEAYTGDFDLGGTVAEVDLLGHSGTALLARAGYVTIDKSMYRIFDVTLPVVVNDLWSQSA